MGMHRRWLPAAAGFVAALVLILLLPGRAAAGTPVVVAATGPSSPTNAEPLTWTVTFSEGVTNFARTDLTVGGTATGCSINPVSGGPVTWTVNVAGCSEGTVTLTLAANAVTSASTLTPGPPSPSTTPAVVVDRTAPTATVTAPGNTDGRPKPPVQGHVLGTGDRPRRRGLHPGGQRIRLHGHRAAGLRQGLGRRRHRLLRQWNDHPDPQRGRRA